jgi:AbrB family looped-hinge helix DNA binding protein
MSKFASMQIEVVIDIISFYDKDIDMSAVTLSSKFQVVIPLDVRESMGLKPGIKLSVFRSGRTIQLVPVPTLTNQIVFNGQQIERASFASHL